jgi:hypothetical protein
MQLKLMSGRPHLTFSSPKEWRGQTKYRQSSIVIKHFIFLSVIGIIQELDRMNKSAGPALQHRSFSLGEGVGG